MKASALNRLHAAYVATPDPLALSAVLEGVRHYAIAKFYRDLDKEDIAQDCVKRVWRSIDPSCLKPLKHFDPNGTASFSSWLSRVCILAREDYRKLAQREEGADADTLERLDCQDPWHSNGRRRVGALPTESYYYEKPDPKCKIPLGNSAWDES